jgi:hypothetical protein
MELGGKKVRDPLDDTTTDELRRVDSKNKERAIRMVKTAVDPALESTSAVEEADLSVKLSQMNLEYDTLISKTKKLLGHKGFNKLELADQAEHEIFYATTLLRRWDISEQNRSDLDAAIVSLESALSKLGYKATQERYDGVTSLGSAYRKRYTVTTEDDDLVQAIRYWEDAHGLSIALRHTKQAVSRT